MKEFSDIGQFIAHLATMAAAETVALHHGLEKCAVAIEKTAKSEIGYYQPQVGYFAAWDPLAPETLKHHEYMGVGDSPLIVTGELYASLDHKTAELEAVIGSTSDIMVYQELGTEKIPPRAVLGPAAIRNESLIIKTLGQAAAEGLLYGAASSQVKLK